MPDKILSEQPFDFGAWRVLPARGLLVSRDNGGEVRIEPQLMTLLLLFAGSDGAVLGKDQIIAAVWGGRAIGDDTLAAAISRLRAALGEAPDHRYIETAPKRGYRLATPRLVPANNPTDFASPVNQAMRLIADGHALLRAGAPSGLPQARLYFEAAIGADPGAAAAQAGLAETLFAQQLADQGPALELLKAARVAAHAAVGLDPASAAGWGALGYAHLVIERDFAKADQALTRAIALAPDTAGPHRYRAFALAAAGRFAEAERTARTAAALNPLSLGARGDLLQIMLAARRFRPAIVEAKALIALASDSAEAWYALGWSRVLLGETAEGVVALLRGLALWGADEANLGALRAAFAGGGLSALCATGADLFQAQQIGFTPRLTDIAFLRAVAGQTDQAFAALHVLIERMDPYRLVLPHLPWLDGLHGDPRWKPMVEQTRLTI